MWANLSYIILVGSQEVTLLTAKASLKLTIKECGASTRIHAYTAETTDIDRIASIFFGVRQSINVPNLLILYTPSQYSNRLIHSYTIEDVIQHLDINEKNKKSFIYNFLTPGTRKRKTLIDLSMISEVHLLMSVTSK